MNITIRKNEYGSLFAYNEQSIYALFQFELREPNMGNGWFFWLRGNYDPDVFSSEEFPMDFFCDACRAKSFLLYHTPLTEEINIVAGKNHLRVKQGR